MRFDFRSDSYIERAPAGTHSDLGCPGLRVRIGKRGAKTWYFRRGESDKRIGRFPHMSLAEARGKVKSLRGDPEVPKKTTNVTVAKLAAFYLENHRTRVSGITAGECADTARRIKRIVSQWGDMLVSDVETAHCIAMLGAYRDRPFEHNHMRAQVRTLWNYAIDIGWLPEGSRNPTRGTHGFPLQKRDRALTDFEVDRIIRAAEDEDDIYLVTYLRVLLETATRPGECRRIKWEDVDMQHKLVKLRKTKSGKTIAAPLNSRAIAALKSLPDERTGFVFKSTRAPGKPLGNPKAAWSRICKRAGVKDAQLKDLRHYRATHLIKSGGSLTLVSKMLGHSDVQVTQRYLDLVDSDLKQLAEL